jgi:chaperonin GroES
MVPRHRFSTRDPQTDPAFCAPAPVDDLSLDKCAPLGKRVLFVPDPSEEKTAGGILLPSSSSAAGAGYITGEVVAVGEAVECVKPGTKALVSGYGGAEVDFQGRKAKFVLDSDVIATLA